MKPLSKIWEKSIKLNGIEIKYPIIKPASAERDFIVPLKKFDHIIHVINVIVPINQYFKSPKSLFSLSPPPNEIVPTSKNDKPIPQTTQADTIGDTIFS